MSSKYIFSEKRLRRHSKKDLSKTKTSPVDIRTGQNRLFNPSKMASPCETGALDNWAATTTPHTTYSTTDRINQCEVTVRSEHDSSPSSNSYSSNEDREQPQNHNPRKGSTSEYSYDDDTSVELIYLLNSQEKSILFQLCAHQLNRLVELSPEALKALITFQPVTSANSLGNQKQFRNSAANSPSNNMGSKPSSSLADKAKSALFTWGGKNQNSGCDVTVLDISVVKILSDHLLQNLDFEGLFRVPGNLIRVEKLKEGIRTGELSNLLATGYFTQHDIASVLKHYLSNIDLIPVSTHLTHLLIANVTHFLDHERSIVKENSKKLVSSLEDLNSKMTKNSPPDDAMSGNGRSVQNMEQLLGNLETLSQFEQKKKEHIEALQIVFCMLSANQRAILKIVLSMLYQVAKNKNITRMSASNLATIFAPHFFASNPTPASMAAQGKCPVNSSASVNLNVTCVENWTLTCYAVTFMIRHWRVALQVPGDLREQVSNYLYARQNASQLINYGSGSNENEKRGRFRAFMKSGGAKDIGQPAESNVIKDKQSKHKRSTTPNAIGNGSSGKHRSKSAHTAITSAFRNRLPGVNLVDKRDSYDVNRHQTNHHHQPIIRNQRHLSPPSMPRTPLKISPLQNSPHIAAFRNTPV